MHLLSLEERQVDVWYVRLDEIADPDLQQRYRQLLPADEAARDRKFLAEKARLQHLVGRVLLRTTLSQYIEQSFQAWTFTYNPYGKPSIASSAEPVLEFNLSHTDGLVVCAVTARNEVGVDVERADRRPEALALARRFFAPSEADVVEQAPAEEQLARFLQFWTLKESFIKARGTGLSMPLDQFAFSVGPAKRATISFTTDCGESPVDWQFAQFQVGCEYRMALAVREHEIEPMSIRVWETVPLVWHNEGRWLPASATNEWTL